MPSIAAHLLGYGGGGLPELARLLCHAFPFARKIACVTPAVAGVGGTL
jgi:hypothetical protein